MKLKVYQQGGGLIYTPFIPGAQGVATGSASSRSGSGEDDTLDPISKEILALMKESNLLPSDIQMIYNRLTTFQKRVQNLPPGMGYSTVMPGLLQLQQLVAIAKDNKKRFDDSAQLMTNREAGGEVALDSYGYMWVQDLENGKISKINPTEYNREKHVPLSNSQVLDLRRANPGLAFDTNSFETVGNNIIGMKQVQQEIADIVKKFGERKYNNFIPETVKNLAEEVAEKGYFNVTVDKTRSLDDLNGFTALLWDGLGNNVRNLLTARAALTNSNPLEYLKNMIFAYSKESVTSDFDSDMSKATGGAGAGSEKLDDKDTYAERLATGQGIVPRWDFIMAGNSGHRLYAYFQNYGTPMANGQSMGTMSMEKFLKEFDASGDIDWSKATLGDSRISTIDLPKIMFKGGSTIKRVWLPVKEDGTVDFRAQQEMAKLQNWIDEEGILNETLIQDRVSEIDNAYWDEKEKVIKFKNQKPFFVLDVVSSSDKVRFDTDSPYVYNMEKGPQDIRLEWLNTYEDVLENGIPGKSKTKIYDFGKTRGRHLYEGLLFLPITNETVATAIYHAQNVNKSRYYDVRNQAETSERQKNLKGNYGG